MITVLISIIFRDLNDFLKNTVPLCVITAVFSLLGR